MRRINENLRRAVKYFVCLLDKGYCGHVRNDGGPETYAHYKAIDMGILPIICDISGY